MSGDNWKTLRVPPEAYDKAKAQKEANNRTWGEQIVRADDDTTDLDTLAASLATIEERTGRIERELDEVRQR